MRIGIFFGGQSREREVSFAGGRTVYDNLNKSVFESVPVFVDSLGNFILLNWEYIYKGTIRDFYPPAATFKKEQQNSDFQTYIESLLPLSAEEQDKIIASVGKKITPEQFSRYFDFAFLTLHGAYGEDGNLQGILEWYHIPYSGSGILPSAIGMNKIIQNSLLQQAWFARPKQQVLSKQSWETQDQALLMEELVEKLGLPLVIKSPNQGSSIGVSILREKNLHTFKEAVSKSLFIQEIRADFWQTLSIEEKNRFIVSFTDIREGLGFPVVAQTDAQQVYMHHPEKLLSFLNKELSKNSSVRLTAQNTEEFILFESYLEGKEFSCIVIQDTDGNPVALPPTEIRKYKDVFDYRSKYLPGTSRKITPIEVAPEAIEKIRQQCCQLFAALHGNVYARIDGFITPKGDVFLNDPNTTSGMMPSSFFFHQAAEIGLDSSGFLTYIIRTSLAERIKTGKQTHTLQTQLQKLDQKLQALQEEKEERVRVAVLMGGYSTERHISMESGRNIYEKLASSTKYKPFPVFLTGSDEAHQLYILPVNYMLKDNVDDIKEKILQTLIPHTISPQEAVLEKIIEETKPITQKYAGNVRRKPQTITYHELAQQADAVFIALHGRPGEDGAVQQKLEKYGLPYNGSGVKSSQTTINKFETNEILRKQGILVAHHTLVYKTDWQTQREAVIQTLEKNFSYPLIAKPADDGCSSAVKKLKNREELIAFGTMMFREHVAFIEKEAKVLQLQQNEEFPQKSCFLIEELIEKGDATHFLEITGGLLTHYEETGAICYEVFEPSETLAQGEVLSLEEKFLAGEGQNITPAIYSPEQEINQAISQKVREELGKVAKTLQIEGYARIDAFVKIFADNQVKVFIIEVNSLPGMTPATCIFHQCAINGYKPYHFIDAIIRFAKDKKKNSKK